ncbi:hypothetical protein FNF29_01186 [Cafeteria roenbergensis]|uniref:Uncharacterized protein n=1 Tax=Cafeteria roenbergensis TaxID=33653 RepID=A0A5A8CVB8_CAFRO|nr:hypothetical protein FNF29_01186 [Cafeteria roenbergensis]|eukprot:KAA0156394.1 hypothetical protein FNF29_01186 [Cafeteria roenbergensis]
MAALGVVVFFIVLVLPMLAITFDAARRNSPRRRLDPGTTLVVLMVLSMTPHAMGLALREALLATARGSLIRLVVTQATVLFCTALTWVMELAAQAMTPIEAERQPLLVAADVMLTVFLNLVTAQELAVGTVEFWLTLAVRCAGLLFMDTRLWEDVQSLFTNKRRWFRFVTARLGWLAVQRADRVLVSEQLALVISAAYLTGGAAGALAGFVSAQEATAAENPREVVGRVTAFAVIFVGISIMVPVVRYLTYAKLARARLKSAAVSILGSCTVLNLVKDRHAAHRIAGVAAAGGSFFGDDCKRWGVASRESLSDRSPPFASVRQHRGSFVPYVFKEWVNGVRQSRGKGCARPRCIRVGILCFGDARSSGQHWVAFQTEYAFAVMLFAALWGSWASSVALGVKAFS